MTSINHGLSGSEAKERLLRDGYNEIAEKKTHPILKFLSYFWGPIPWMIEAAIVLSALNQEWADFYIILVLLFTNALIGFFQEYKADTALERLKSRLALKARVLRDGYWIQIDSRELVIGDVIRIRQGDIVPADVKLSGEGFLLVDESVLTGESLPVEKKDDDIAYSGAIIKRGEMTALVTSIGMNTFFGKTAKLASQEEDESHFQKTIIKIGTYLIRTALILAAIILIVEYLRHQDLRITLQFILILVVASIPAALPAVLSITLAVGAINLAKKEAIVRKMTAIEEIAGMDILCIDKTGTITENNITLGIIKPLKGYKEDEVLLYSALCSRREDLDPIDIAILSKADSNIKLSNIIKTYSVTSFTPYDPISKYATAEIVLQKGRIKKSFSVAKGAPQVILALTHNARIKPIIDKYVEEFALKGERALGVAIKYGKNWKYVGLLALYDPPRIDSAETLKIAQRMGVHVKIITGDHKAVTQDIARKIDLGNNIISISEIKNSSDFYNYESLERADGISEVFPEHKYNIVKLLQDHDHIVGMTGDGVNDAPALKKANCGIAVANSTDAAKSSADIVLTKAGTSVIIDSIIESRNIFQRMNNYAIYRIAETMRLMLFITASILIFGFYPISAVMIVLLVILNDVPILTIAYDNVLPSDMPVRWKLKNVLKMATFLGVLGVISSFLMLYIGLDILHLSLPVIQTLIFLKLAIAGHLMVFTARTKGHFWSIAPAKSLLFATLGTQIVATLVAVYGLFVTPIGWGLAIFAWLYAILFFLITNAMKVELYKRIG